MPFLLDIKFQAESSILLFVVELIQIEIVYFQTSLEIVYFQSSLEIVYSSARLLISVMVMIFDQTLLARGSIVILKPQSATVQSRFNAEMNGKRSPVGR